MPTIDEVRAKIQRNMPSGQRSARVITWDKATRSTMLSSCGRFQIDKSEDGERDVFSYSAFTVPNGLQGRRKVAGPFMSAKECREAVQDYANGEPMQASLA